MAGSSRVGSGWFIADIDYFPKTNLFCSISHKEKLSSFKDITVLNVLYDCEKKFSTASSLLFGLSCSKFLGLLQTLMYYVMLIFIYVSFITPIKFLTPDVLCILEFR